MPINTDTPAIRPPRAKDLQKTWETANPDQTFDPTQITLSQAGWGEGGGFPAGPAGAGPVEHETAPGAFRGAAAAPGLENFASGAMADPSRYDSQLIQDFTSQIDTDLAAKRQAAQVDLDEFMSQRGMVGSNVEGELYSGMLTDLEAERTRRMTDLNKAAADAWAQDRAGAADIGFRSGEFQRALGGDEENAARWASEFGQGQYEFEQQYGTQNAIQREALRLQEKGMDLDEAYRQAQATVQEGQFAYEQEQQQSQFESQLSEAQQSRIQQYGLDTESLGLKAQEIQNQAQQAGREMDIREATNQAEIDLRIDEMAQQAELAGEEFNIQRERLTMQNEQFQSEMTQQQAQLEESRLGRLQELGLSNRQLDQETERIQIANKDMNLQEARDEAEVQYRSEQLQLESDRLGQELTLEEARLQAQTDQFEAEHEAQQSQWAESLGMQEKEYSEQVEARKAEYTDRTAARVAEMGLQKGSIKAQAAENKLNRTLEREAHAIQEAGISSDEAMRQAEIDANKEIELERTRISELGIDEQTAEREARFEEMQAQRLSTESLETAAQAIQELGITEEAAWRLADQELTETLETAAQTIQSEGITAETARRKATDKANERMQDSRNSTEKALMNLGIDADVAAALLDKSQQTSLLNLELGSREAIAEAANTQMQAGLDAETAWRAATDAANEAMTDANNTARSTLQTSLTELGIDADKAAYLAQHISNEAMNTANNTSRESIASEAAELRTWEIDNEKARWEALHDMESEHRTADRELREEELSTKRWATEEQMKQRESEFQRSSAQDRLAMILDALKSDAVDPQTLKHWLTVYSPGGSGNPVGGSTTTTRHSGSDDPDERDTSQTDYDEWKSRQQDESGD